MSIKKANSKSIFLLIVLFVILAGNTSITNAIPAVYQISIKGVQVTEGTHPTIPTKAKLEVSLDRPFAVNGTELVTVQYRTIGGTAIPKVDYGPVNNTLSFTDLAQTQTIEVNIRGDRHVEADENIIVELFNPSQNAEIAVDKAPIRILDDDQADIVVFKYIKNIDKPRTKQAIRPELETCNSYQYNGRVLNRGKGNLWGTPVIVIDRLSPLVEFLEASKGGVYDKKAHAVRWVFRPSIKSPFKSGEVRHVWINFKVMDKIRPGAIIENSLHVRLPDFFRFPNHQNFTADPFSKNNHYLHKIQTGIGLPSATALVFCDANNNGEKDEDEVVIPGVRLRLYTQDDPPTDNITEQWTVANGTTRFKDLKPGDYRMIIDESTLPEGAVSTTGDNFSDVSLSPCQHYFYAYFGYNGFDCTEAQNNWDNQRLNYDFPIIRSSKTWPDEGWDNLIDGDVEDWDGTVTAFTTEGEIPYAIIALDENLQIAQFNEMEIVTDNGTDDDRWTKRKATKVELLVSTTGTEDADFTSVTTMELSSDNINYKQKVGCQSAKYVKIKLLTPTAWAKFAQIVELRLSSCGRQLAIGQSLNPADQCQTCEYPIVNSSKTWPDEGWDNLVDGDEDGWDGTVTAYTTDGIVPFATIALDKSLQTAQFNEVEIVTDNGTDDDRWTKRKATKVELLVSTTGTEDTDFTSVGTVNLNQNDTKIQKNIGSQSAKYVKIKILSPGASATYAQIVELRFFNNGQPVSIGQSSNSYNLVALPESTQLMNAYPNPFNPQTTIEYNLMDNANVSILVFDLQGREVDTLVDGHKLAGFHNVVWDAHQCASGTYFVVMQTGQLKQTKKVILLK